MKSREPEKIVAVGALGGSGTRAVAQVLIDAGVYLGDDLNGPNDNLIFTRLFKNPEWYRNAPREAVRKRLTIFARYMRGEQLSISELKEFFNASITNPFVKSGAHFYPQQVLRNLLENKRKRSKLWGWKEPNNQLFIEEIKNYFPRIRYVHVLRNGFDMAFSKNIQQLRNWGYIYGVDFLGTENEEEKAVKQLEYWIKSSEDVIERGKELFGDSFYLLNHTDFCLHPQEEVEKFLHFLELDVSKERREKLFTIPRVPKSFDRYKQYDVGIFSSEQVEGVRRLGFEV